ncbi:hypothetical protein PsorP6_012151 [Peronosclerospora sorghi]|uniref:Uncharacterized protein n=1 Tax=Peronosclerospora sorghi TaxID=230839 RepID=A0ACC0WLG6_9STRA|nr:hypothetical protein PsorP6_012151 [Peronosclerospora sorghi]
MEVPVPQIVMRRHQLNCQAEHQLPHHFQRSIDAQGRRRQVDMDEETKRRSDVVATKMLGVAVIRIPDETEEIPPWTSRRMERAGNRTPDVADEMITLTHVVQGNLGYNASRTLEETERTPPREARAKPTASPKQARPIVSNKAPTGGTVYTGLNSYERVAQFAQLAAFEAPAPPPPSRPPKPIQTVAVSDAIPKRVRAPAQPPRQAAQTPRQAAPPAPKHPSFYIDENLVNEDYDILSPKTARSLAPSIASAATTVIAPGRNRPTPLQQGRRAQQSNATPSYYQSGYSRDDNKYGDENRYGNDKRDETGLKSTFKATSNYNDSFVSESSAWSAASDISDDSYYHAAPSNTARIPVIEAPRDDDDQSEDGYSDWGHSTQQNADDFRSTGASDSSFFSVNSDFSNSTSVFKEREF